MNKLRNWFFFLLMISGFPIFYWASYSLIIDSYSFWKYGSEEKGKVIALDSISGTSKSGITYYYEIEFHGKRMVDGFRLKLPINKTLTFLVLKDGINKITLGNKNSSFYELFSYSVGGNFFATLFLGLFTFMLITGPPAFYLLIKNWRVIIELSD